MKWCRLTCHWCGKGESYQEGMYQNKNGRRMCGWCFEENKAIHEDFEEGGDVDYDEWDEGEEKGADGADLDIRDQAQDSEEPQGEDEADEDNFGHETISEDE